MSATIEISKNLSNGTPTTLQGWREKVAEIMAVRLVTSPELREVDAHYGLAIGLSEWQNVKRNAAGYEATRRAALALIKLAQAG